MSKRFAQIVADRIGASDNEKRFLYKSLIKTEEAPTAGEKTVEFRDYDGTIVESYTKEEFSKLTALPENPSHPGLIAKGWNWNLNEAKAYVEEVGGLIIGQVYKTEDGGTKIYVTIEDPSFNMSVYFKVSPIAANAIIDWGDGSTTTGDSTAFKIYKHRYSAAGDYIISINTKNSDTAISFYYNNNAISLVGDSTTTYNKKRVTRVYFGDTVSIGGYTLAEFPNLKTVIIPDTITFSSHTNTFNNSGVKYITIPKTVSSLGGEFGGIEAEYISFPNNLINPGTWNDARKLKKLYLPKTVTTIASSGFSGCWSLEEVGIISATTVGGNTFSSTLIKEIRFTAKLTTLEGLTAAETKQLKVVTFTKGSPTTIEDSAFTNSSIQSCDLSDTITVKANAFKNSCIEEVKGDNIETLLNQAFAYCKSLKTVYLPKIKTLDSLVFNNCIKLLSVQLGEGLTSIGQSAFDACKALTKIEIPSTVISIGAYAFRATNIKTATMLATVPPQLGTGVFVKNILSHLYVPAESVNTYKTATNWSAYASVIEAIPTT